VRIEVKEEPASEKNLEAEALTATSRRRWRSYPTGKMIPPDLAMVLESLTDAGRFADLVAANVGLSVKDAQSLLETVNPVDRLRRLNEWFRRNSRSSRCRPGSRTRPRRR